MDKFTEMVNSWKEGDEMRRKEQERKKVELRVEVEQFKRGTDDTDKSDLIKEVKDLGVTVEKMRQLQTSDEILYVNAQVTSLANDLAEMKYQMGETSASQSPCHHGDVEESLSMIKKVEEDIVIMKQQSQELRDTVVKLRPFQHLQPTTTTAAASSATSSAFSNICNEVELQQKEPS